MSRLTWLVLAAGLVMQREALACPQCAGRDTYGMSFVFLLFSMIALPFSIVAVVIRVVRSMRQEIPVGSKEMVK